MVTLSYPSKICPGPSIVNILAYHDQATLGGELAKHCALRLDTAAFARRFIVPAQP